jgi:hypothetical protein
VTLATPDRTTASLIGVGTFGFVLALAAGAVAASGYGVLLAGALLGLAVCAVGIAVYIRDPVRALIWLWIVVVLGAPVSVLVGYDSPAGQRVGQADEVLVLLLVGLTAWRTLTTNTRIPLWFIPPIAGVALFGLLGAVIHHVPLAVSIPGAWLGLKLWIMVGVALLLPWRTDDLERVYKAVSTIGVIVAGLGFADFLTQGAASDALGLHGVDGALGDSRANAVHAIFYHPAQFSLFLSLLFALTFARFAGRRSKSDLALALLFAGSVLLSLRLKGFLSLAAVVTIVALAHNQVRARSALTVVLIGSLLVGGAYGLQSNVINRQASLYTSSESTGRAQLYRAGERIARDNFPLGVGFGRFASYPSRLHYSPVYDDYELSSVYGLSRQYPNFIDDTAWPSVMGETGYAGLAAYVAGILLLILLLVRGLRNVPMAMRWVPLAALCTLAVILIDSLGSPALFDWVAAVTFALILGPAMALARGPDRHTSKVGESPRRDNTRSSSSR